MTNNSLFLRFGDIILVVSIMILVFMMVSSGKAYVDYSHYVKYVNDDWRHTISIGDSVFMPKKNILNPENHIYD